MACSACSKRRAAAEASRQYTVMGGYKNLPDRIIKARLEVYKKRYCSECVDRYKCDYQNYVKCKESG